MLGRLSRPPAGTLQAFPWREWRDEFERARHCGFDCLEWLVTAERVDENPIWTAAGVQEIRGLSDRTGVKVTSICADSFIANPFVRVSEAERDASLARLGALVRQAAAAGIRTIAVPVIEHGELRTPLEGARLVAALSGPLEEAGRLGVRVGLECDWPGDRLRSLLESASQPLFAYYDVGNARARGHDPARDIAALGDRLCGVHIKDRTVNGPSVALGAGDVDVAAAIAALDAAGYDGPLILETPAGADPIASAKKNRSFVTSRL